MQTFDSFDLEDFSGELIEVVSADVESLEALEPAESGGQFLDEIVRDAEDLERSQL